jgi:hypothetical protein
MTDEEHLERLERWVDKVVEESALLSEDSTEEEIRERQSIWYADYFTLEDGWLMGAPDDPEMRRWLIEEEGMAPDFADQVLGKMSELAVAR